MITTYEVVRSDGEVRRCLNLAEVRAIVQVDPGALVNPVVTYRPCALHPAYEPENCPDCGTGASIG